MRFSFIISYFYEKGLTVGPSFNNNSAKSRLEQSIRSREQVVRNCGLGTLLCYLKVADDGGGGGRGGGGCR